MSTMTISISLITDIKKLIDDARQRVAQTFNSELSFLYWQIGRRLQSEILKGERAEYGKQIVKNVSQNLIALYGRGWSEKQLWHCLRFVETFPDIEKVSAVRRQLSWTQIKSLVYMSDPLKRDFYLQLCQIENWSSREFQDRISSMFYERTALSKQPDALIKQELDAMSKTGTPSPAALLKDPYLLDFLGLNDRFLEKDLEDAILREYEQIELLELNKSGIHVAEYLTVLPPREVLQAKLHYSIEQARRSVESKEESSITPPPTQE